MNNGKHIGAPSPMFVRQLGEKLASARKANRTPLWFLARKSKGEFTASLLRDAEGGLLPIDAATVESLASLYSIELVTLLPGRSEGVTIDPMGVISAGGRTVEFDPSEPTSMVSSYFALVRSLRSMTEHEPLTLRNEEVGLIAKFLDTQGKGSDVLQAIVAVAEAQRRITVSSLLVGAASAGLINLPPDSAAHRSAREHAEHQSDNITVAAALPTA